MFRLFRWLGNIALPNTLEWLRLTSGTGYCWHCEWPRKGKICPIHKVKMQPMRGHKFK